MKPKLFCIVIIALGVAACLYAPSAFAYKVLYPAQPYQPNVPRVPTNTFVPRAPTAPTATFYQPHVANISAAAKAPQPNYVAPPAFIEPYVPVVPQATFIPQVTRHPDVQTYVPTVPVLPGYQVYQDP